MFFLNNSFIIYQLNILKGYSYNMELKKIYLMNIGPYLMNIGSYLMNTGSYMGIRFLANRADIFYGNS